VSGNAQTEGEHVSAAVSLAVGVTQAREVVGIVEPAVSVERDIASSKSVQAIETCEPRADAAELGF